MDATIRSFEKRLRKSASDVLYHRDDSLVPCPCRSPEGFRDPLWHNENPDEAMCNEAGFLTGTPIHITVKAFIQPIQSTRATRLQSEQVAVMFGEILADDHLGIFPVVWNGIRLHFSDWGLEGEDYIGYDGRKFTVVNTNKMPSPHGSPDHHYEVALRLVKNAL